MRQELPDLTDALIDDLFDLTRCFGRTVPEGPILFIAATEPKTMFVCVSAIFGARQMHVMARHDEVVHADPYLIPLGRNGSLLWDAQVSVEDAKAFIAATDARVRAADPQAFVGGERDRIDYELSEKLFTRSVEATFPSPDALMPIRQPAMLLVIRAQFDHPAKLVPFVDGFGYTYLCRLAHLEEVKRRHAAMMRVCTRWKIIDRQQLATLSPEDIKRFRQDFEQELERRPN